MYNLWVDRVIKLDKIILSLYRELAKLEIGYGRESTEYRKAFMTLKNALSLDEKLYEKIGDKRQVAYQLRRNVAQRIFNDVAYPNNIESRIDAVIEQDDLLLIGSRIISFLDQRFIGDKEYTSYLVHGFQDVNSDDYDSDEEFGCYLEESSESLEEMIAIFSGQMDDLYFSKSGYSSSDKSIDSGNQVFNNIHNFLNISISQVSKRRRVEEALFSEYLRIIPLFLKDYTNIEEVYLFGDAIHMTIFINRQREIEFMHTPFNQREVIARLSDRLLASKYDLDNAVYMKTKDMLMYHVLMHQFNKLLKFDKTNRQSYNCSLVRKACVRSGLVFMGTAKMNELAHQVTAVQSMNEYDATIDGYEIVESIFKAIGQDIENVPIFFDDDKKR